MNSTSTLRFGLVEKLASREDIPPLMVIFQDACDRLGQLGVRQWPRSPSQPLVEAAIQARQLHLFLKDDAPAAMCRLLWSDEDTWGFDDGTAGYVHMLAVHRKFAGKGIGARVLDWASEQIRTAGKSRLRLDCMANNTKLRSYYISAGLRFCGERQVGKFCVALFERACGG